MARSSIKTGVIKKLYALSGNRCAFPGCNQVMVDDDGDVLSQICHIESAEEGGERYNHYQTDEERRCFENLILFCHIHHVKTNNVEKYTVDILKKMKADHEKQFSNTPYEIPSEFEEKVIRRVNEILNKLYSIAEKTYSKVEEINGNVGHLINMVSNFSSSLVFDDTKVYAVQLDFIRRLRADKKPTTALHELEKFRIDNWGALNPELKFKVLANAGLLLIELGRSEDAAGYFVDIASVGFESADSLAFTCFGYALLSMRSEFDSCFKKAKLIGSDNINLWIAYLKIYGQLKSIEELRSEIPTSLLEDRLIQFSIGKMLVEKGSVSEGFAMMKKSVYEVTSKDPGYWQLVGIYVGLRLSNILTPMAITLKSISIEERAILIEAIEMLTNTLDDLYGTESFAAAWSLLLNRGQCHRVLGDNDGAIRDFEEGWRVSRNSQAFMLLINIYTIDKDFARGRKLLGERACVSHKSATELAHMEFGVSRFEVAAGNYSEALLILKRCLDFVGVNRLKVLNDIVILCLEAQNNEDAFRFASQGVAEYPNDAEASISLGTCLLNIGDKESAIERLDFAYKILEKGHDDNSNWYALGLEYFRIKQYEKAILCLSRIAFENRLDDVNLKIILSYFYIHKFQDVITLGEKLHFEDIGNITLNEVLLRTYGILNNVGGFSLILADSLKLGNAATRDKFRLLGIQQCERWKNSVRAIELATELESPLDMEIDNLYIIAGLLLRNNQAEKGLELAYNTRLKFYDVGESHRSFFQIWINYLKEKDVALFFDEVRVKPYPF